MSEEQENLHDLYKPTAPINESLIEPISKGPVTPPPFQQPPFSQFGGDFGQQNLPNGTIALVLGILSIPACCCYGIFGLILGIIAWVLASSDVKKYNLNPNAYTLSSYKNTKAGKVCGIVGTILSIFYLIAIIATIAFFGWAALKDPQLMKEILESKNLQ